MRPPYRILFLDTKPRNPNRYLSLSVFRALQQNPQVEAAILAGYGDAIDLARERRCNLFWAFDGEEIELDICERLRQICGLAVCWYTEDPFELHVNVSTASVFDLVFSNDLKSAAAYGRKGRHLTLAADERLHRREVLRDADLRYDVFFAGSPWPNRVRLLRSLVRDLRGRKLKISLPSTPHVPEPDLGIPPSAIEWRAQGIEFARFANRSRVTLALARGFSGTEGEVEPSNTPPPRVFETALAGGAQAADACMTELSRHFSIGSEILTFSNYDECLTVIQRILDNPDLRYALAANSQKRTLAAHTYRQRAAEILQAVAQCEPPRPRRSAASAKPRVLYVTHNVHARGPQGGAEVYQDLMARNLSSEFEILFFTPRSFQDHRTYDVLDSRYQVLESIFFGQPADFHALTDPGREPRFAELLTKYNIALVHFHHLIWHLPSYLLLCRALGVPTVLTLHDYWVMCDSFNLLDHQNRYCDIARQPDTTCEVCVSQRRGHEGGLMRRREIFRRCLDAATVILVNTSGYPGILRRFYPAACNPQKLRVLPVPMPRTAGARVPRRGRGTDHLQVAILGNFSVPKGAEPILLALEALRHDRVHFTLFGRVDEPFQSVSVPNLTIHGSYLPAELPRLLAGFDVSLHPSIWPETYCIALSEAWANGLVPVVTNLGALGERVQHGVDGFVVRADHPGDLVELIRRIAADPSMLDAMRLATDPDKICTEEWHTRQLGRLYRDLLASHESYATPPPPVLARESRLDYFACGYSFFVPAARKIGPAVTWSSVEQVTVEAGNRLRLAGPPAGQAVAILGPRMAATGIGCVDRIDDTPVGPKAQTIIMGRSEPFLIQGWTFELDSRTAHPKVYLVLSAEGRPPVSFPLSRTPRPDVATAYGGEVEGDCGFAAHIPTAGLAAAPYRVSLAQATEGGHIATLPGNPFPDLTLSFCTEPILEIQAEGGSIEAAKILSVEGAAYTTRSSGGFNATTPRRETIEIGGTAMLAEPSDRLFVHLRSPEDGTSYYFPVEQAEAGERVTFQVLARATSIAAGLYTVSLTNGSAARALGQIRVPRPR